MFDLIVKGGTLADGRVADIGITGGKISAIAAPAIRRPAFSYGRYFILWHAAYQRVGHFAGRDRTLGRTEAGNDPR